MERRHTVCQYGYTIRAIFASGGSDPVCGAPVSRKELYASSFAIRRGTRPRAHPGTTFVDPG